MTEFLQNYLYFSDMVTSLVVTKAVGYNGSEFILFLMCCSCLSSTVNHKAAHIIAKLFSSNEILQITTKVILRHHIMKGLRAYRI